MPEPSLKRSHFLRLTLSLRALMLVVLIVGGGLGWFIGRVRRQAETVDFLRREFRAIVQYDWEYRDGVTTPFPAKSPWPAWMMKRLGPDWLGHVTSITLREPPHLHGDELTRRLRSLPRLERVCLWGSGSNRHPTDADLAVIGQLDRLKRLEVEYNQFTSTGLASLKGMIRLEDLRMPFHSPDRAGFAQLCEIKTLKILIIDTTDLGDDSLAALENLTELRELELINDHEYDRVGRLIRNDKITSTGLKPLTKLKHLKRLTLSGTKIDHLEPIKDLKSLRELRLDCTDVDNQGLATIGELPNLELLSLEHTKINDAGLVHLEKLSKLRLLNLEAPDISDARIVHVSKLSNLEKLNIESTGVSDVGIDRLLRLTRCKSMRIPNGISNEGRVKLQKGLPGATINRYNTFQKPLF